jgi:general nucleoside transport system ATP-binding protein
MVIPSGTHRAVTAPAPRLALDSIRCSYGSVVALAGARLSVASGTVHALLGENGAGKSTLMKIAYGLARADAGTIAIDGVNVAIRSPRHALSRGIGMVQQHFALVDAMTVAENVALGNRDAFSLAATSAAIRTISAESGLTLDPDAVVRDLPIGAQQRVEIVKALTRNASILILDEPTAVLSPTESTELLAWTRRFADRGGTVILIAHKLREVLSVADQVTVLRRGRTVLTADAHDVTEASLASAMLGESGSRASAPPSSLRTIGTGPPVLMLSQVSVAAASRVMRLRDASLTIRAGEMVGVAALENAGQRELLRVLAGRLTPTRGQVRLPASVGFVPEDRHRDAVVLDASLTENIALRGAQQRRGIIAWSALRATTVRIMRERDVRAHSEGIALRTLSGGNQQKLVLGRELSGAPAALVVENPTRGPRRIAHGKGCRDGRSRVLKRSR